MRFVIEISVFGGGDTFVVAEEFKEILIVVKACAASDQVETVMARPMPNNTESAPMIAGINQITIKSRTVPMA